MFFSKKKLIFISLFIGLLFFSQKAKATETLSIDNSAQTNLYSPGYSVNGQRYGQSFIALNNNISSFTIWNANIPASATCGDSCTFYIKLINALATSTPLYEGTFIRTNTDGTEQNFKFDDPIGLDIGGTYFIVWESAGGTGDNFSFEATLDNDGEYLSGDLIWYSGGDYVNYGTQRDAKFQIYYDTDYTPWNYVKRINPQPMTWNLPFGLVEFKGWYNSNGLRENLWIEILKYDDLGIASHYRDVVASSTFGMYQAFATSTYLTEGNYAWLASLADNNLENRKTGSAVDIFWNFSVAYETGEPVPVIIPDFQTATSTSDKAWIYCDQVSTSTPGVWYGWLAKWINDGIRDTICNLFIPNEYFLTEMASSTNNLSLKEPIGYVKLSINAIKEIATSSSATSSPSWLDNKNFYVLKSIANLGILTLFKTGISILFIILGFVYIIKRIRSLIKL